MSQHVGDFAISLERVGESEFRIRFDMAHYSELRADEPPPHGGDAAPNAARLLAAAIGHCLSANLLICANEANVALSQLKADVRVDLVQNERKRLRIGQISVRLQPVVARGDLTSCIEAFEEFCSVTESVREGIDVNVSVEPAEG